jgi:hypothetical protein
MASAKKIFEQLLADEGNGGSGLTIDLKLDDLLGMTSKQVAILTCRGVHRLNTHGSLFARRWVIRLVFGGIGLFGGGMIIGLVLFDHLGVNTGIGNFIVQFFK